MMGATTFVVSHKGDTPQKAFEALVEGAQHEFGHDGYTGSIAEKGSFRTITVPEGQDVALLIRELLDDGDHWIDDKFGPAGHVEVDGEHVFFGWASE